MKVRFTTIDDQLYFENYKDEYHFKSELKKAFIKIESNTDSSYFLIPTEAIKEIKVSVTE